MTITANMTTTIPTVDLMSQKPGRTVAADATGILTITALQRMSRALHRNITTAIVMAVQLVTAAVTATDRRVRHARIRVSDLPVPWVQEVQGVRRDQEVCRGLREEKACRAYVVLREIPAHRE